MKKFRNILFAALVVLLALSCKKDNGMSGAQSDFGLEGTRISTLACDQIESENIRVMDLTDGVSTIAGTFVTRDPHILKLVSNNPKYFTVEGNTVTVKGIKYKMTDKGIARYTGGKASTVVKYDAKVGDTYVNGGKVTHVSKSEDFAYALWNIKVIKVEQDKPDVNGIEHLSYWANHKFGLVAVEATYSDGTTQFTKLAFTAPI